jgi:hypothetical protein
MHYQKILENIEKYPELKSDKRLIETQIKQLSEQGHDVQLHLHPHWLDAQYQDGQWILNDFRYYKLQNLSNKKIKNIVKTAKQTIEKITHKSVFIFRAGGWCIEPFDKITLALQENGIYIDSSIATAKYSYSKIADYDFRGYPKKKVYNFTTPKKVDKEGFFKEVQISTVKLANYLIFYDYIKRFLKPINFEIFGDGIGIAGKSNPFKNSFIIIKRLLLGSRDMLALEFSSELLFRKALVKTDNNSVMIGHPKSLGKKHFEVLEDLFMNKKLQFISLKDFIND